MQHQTVYAPTDNDRHRRDAVALLEAKLERMTAEYEACQDVIQSIVKVASGGEMVSIIDRFGASVTVAEVSKTETE